MKTLSLLCTLGAAVCGLSATPVSAMQQGREQSREEVFVNLGRWIIVQDEGARACELRLSGDPRFVLRYRMEDGRAGLLAIERRSGRFFTGMVGDVEWAFDDTRFAGYLSGDRYALSAGSRDVEAVFRSAKFLSVLHGGSQVARIDLKTSSAGFRLLKQCAEQWRYIPWYRRLASTNTRELERPRTRPVADASSSASSPSTPSPRTRPGIRENSVAPPVEAPSLTTPLAARPINPGQWISSSDSLPWPSRGFRSGQGLLRFTLLVDEEGRAESCEVDRSTGSRRFDRQACRLLIDRARFEPARGSDGEVVQSRYSSTLRFAEE
ncbi:energy transducer TonB [uncultured Erythrobacter sp.]|uniref:energy transducer TonB n=1 Tax=uncultured Erythrobacter sp. TaxID=263913 RepID=UPI00260B51A3|nr:TonB family protein [uncultured Erythrobacter sp.]